MGKKGKGRESVAEGNREYVSQGLNWAETLRDSGEENVLTQVSRIGFCQSEYDQPHC